MGKEISESAHVKADQLLEVLRRVEVEGVARILEHTNMDLVLRVFNGPLEAAVGTFASSLAEAMRHPTAASTVKQMTDRLNDSMIVADICHTTNLKVLCLCRRGILEHKL